VTFIISAASRNAAFQVADTRVTRAVDGVIRDDFSVKTIVLHCKDAKLIMSFTGLASIRGNRTDKWISAKLSTFNAWNKVFQEVMIYLRDELTTERSKDKKLEQYALEVAVIGLGISPTGVRQPAVALITNCSEPETPRSNFRNVPNKPFERYVLNPEARHIVGISGAIGGPKLALNGLRRKLQRQLQGLREGEEPRSVLDRLVAMLRLHRQQDPGLARVIGEYCVGVAIKSDFTVVSGSYGPRGGKLLIPRIIRAPTAQL